VRPSAAVAAAAVVLGACAAATANGSADAPPASADGGRQGFVRGAGGVRLFYEVTGSGTDTVVVVHGGPGAGLGSIAPDLAPLAERHVVVHFDQRGGGRSDLPADTALLHARYLVEDLEAVRRHFRLERLTLLAHASGALVAARYAEAHPERVARMVFVGAIGPRLADAAAYARSVYTRMDEGTARDIAELVRALKSDTTSDVAAVCREYERRFRAVVAPAGAGGQERGTTCTAPPEAIRYANRFTSEATFNSFGAWDFTRSLGRVAVPLLVVYGDRDARSVPAQRVWSAAVPNGRLLVISGAGRAPHVDRPEQFFAAVDAFLAGGWPEGAVPPPR
jgi:proline iminopeptidase